MIMGMIDQKTLLKIGLSLTLIAIAVCYLYPPDRAATSLPTSIEARSPIVKRHASSDGMQWMGALPISSANKQEHSRSLGETIASLTATRNPEDALRAYQLIGGCEALRRMFEIDPLPPALEPQKKQCASITDAVRRSRHDYLRMAAYGRAHGAGSDWLHYGPLGDPEALRTRPNDPSVIEWKREATALVIRDGDEGDVNALQDLMNGYAGKTPFFDADPSRALAYAIAYKDVVDLLKLEGMQNQPTDADIEVLTATLSPEQVGWAKTFAAAIVATKAKKLASASQ